MTERSSGRSTVSLVVAGGVLLAVGYVWGRNSALRAVGTHQPRATAPPAPAEETAASPILQTELERLAGVAVSHGRDDPALDVFLAFVGALDPSPAAAILQPAAQRIGERRLVQALDRPGDAGLGARRLLAAGPGVAARPEPTPTVVTVERPVEHAGRLPELFDALRHAIRGALSLLL